MPVTVDLAKLRVLVDATAADTDDKLGVYAGMATNTVTQFLGGQLNDTILNDIALQLAGHFWILSRERGGIKFMKIGQSEESYQGVGNKTLVGFQTTRFGQMACALDTTGVLASASQPGATVLAFKSYSAAGR